MVGNPVFTGNAHDVDQAIDRVQKAISSTNVSGLLLVREDLQSEMAIAAPTDTPIRNRLSRIEGNGSAHAWYKLVPTAQTEGSFIGTAPSTGFFARGGLPTATQAAYRYMSAPYVCLGDLVEVTSKRRPISVTVWWKSGCIGESPNVKSRAIPREVCRIAA